MRAAVLHNSDKQASVSFWYRGEYKRLTLKVKDRAEALRHINAYYRGAQRVSVVFFVRAEEAKESQDEPS